MTDNEKIAALAAALDGMKAERNWYRTAWTEAFRERDVLRVRLDSLKQSENATSAALAKALEKLDAAETELEHANNSLAFVREERDNLIEAANRCENRVASLEYKNRQLRDQLAESTLWRERMSEDFRDLRKQRDDLLAWYRAVMEDAEEFGVGG